MDTNSKDVSPRKVTVRVFTSYGEGEVTALIDITGDRFRVQGGRIELSLVHLGSGKILGTRTVPLDEAVRRREARFSLPEKYWGTYAFRARVFDRNGIAFLTDLLHDRSVGELPWLGSREGMDRGVPEPWSPLTVHRTDADANVSCWGRRHRFDGRSLVGSIVSGGVELLGGPVRLVLRDENEGNCWEAGTFRFVSQGPEQVILVQEFVSSRGISVSAWAEVDFDGVIRFDVALHAEEETVLKGLDLEIPIRAEVAKYLYYFPGRWGSAENSGALPKRTVSMAFHPYFWIGDEERGLSWFAESDQNWISRNPQKAVEIRREDGNTVLRLHLVSLPIRLKPSNGIGSAVARSGEESPPIWKAPDIFRYEFGLQATPVKPITADAWDHRIMCIIPQTQGVTPRLTVSDDLLDAFVKAGVRTVVLFEGWADAEGYVETPHEEAVRRIVAACHARGLKILLYFGFLLSDIAPPWRDMGKDCIVLPKKGYPVYTYHPQPVQAAWDVCLNSQWQDLLVEGIAKAIERFDIDGLYLDGTEYPFACCNTEHGCGKTTSDGSVAPTYPLFAVRSALRRIYAAVKTRKPEGQINIHNSTCMTMPTLEWATSYWDGEQFQLVPKGVDVRALLPLDAFRAEFMGRQWGIAPEFLQAGESMTFKQAFACALLHDVPVRPNYPGPDLDLLSRIWDVMDRFDRKSAEWIPYWRNGGYVQASPRSIYVSLYRSPRNGVLAVIANMGRKDSRARVSFDVERLRLFGGSLSAVDVLEGTPVAVVAGRFSLHLPSLEFALILIKPAE